MARGFNGTSDTITNGSAAGATSAYSVGCWYRRQPTASGVDTIFEKAVSASFQYRAWYDSADDKIKASNDSTSANTLASGAGLVPEGTWHHILLTYSGAGAKTMTLYIDGVQAAQASNTNSPATTASEVHRLGSKLGTADWMVGDIAEWATWSSVLSQAEITELAGSALPGQIATAPSRHIPCSGFSLEYSVPATTESTITGTTFASHPPQLIQFTSPALGNGMGSASSISSGTTLAITTTTYALPADELALLAIGSDNIGTGDGDNTEVTGVADDQGNTWVKVKEFTNGQGSAAAGVTGSLWITPQPCIPIPIGAVVTITFTSAITSKCAAIRPIKVPAGMVAVVANSATLANDAADPGSLSANLAAVEPGFWWRLFVGETNSSSGTATSHWVFTAGAVADTTVAGTSIRLRNEIIMLAGDSTGIASDPSLAAVDCASVMVAFVARRMRRDDMQVRQAIPRSTVR